ncbi:MAG: hypothetical protein V2A69_04465 [Pseudomonadota bacterium]
MSGEENKKMSNKLEDVYGEFESSMSANVIVQGPKEVIDLRSQLLNGCVQCGKRISEFMLPQDIACALTSGVFEIKPGSQQLLSGLWNNTISFDEGGTKIDGLVRASGDTAEVLKNLKEADPKKFLQVLVILWRYQKEKKRGQVNTL